MIKVAPGDPILRKEGITISSRQSNFPFLVEEMKVAYETKVDW